MWIKPNIAMIICPDILTLSFKYLQTCKSLMIFALCHIIALTSLSGLNYNFALNIEPVFSVL